MPTEWKDAGHFDFRVSDEPWPKPGDFPRYKISVGGNLQMRFNGPKCEVRYSDNGERWWYGEGEDKTGAICDLIVNKAGFGERMPVPIEPSDLSPKMA